MARRPAALRAAVFVLAASVLAACASNGPVATPSVPGAASVEPPPKGGSPEPQRSDRGNPPFYDVLGKRYRVLESSDGYHARGVASWYGRDFHGLATSSGEPYNMHAMTAAHTTLPIPTWVEVTNLANNKRVVVKVNDRGPFVDNRLIDLSYAAAVQLDMIRTGTARVEVRALRGPPGAVPATATASAAAVGGAQPGAPSASPAPPPGGQIDTPRDPVLAPPVAVPSGSAGAAEQLYVQVGAFADAANAERLVARLKVNGFTDAFVATDSGERRALHRVRVGPLRDAQEFDAVRARLRSLGLGESQLVTAR
jgi:rare lipoprotein A